MTTLRSILVVSSVIALAGCKEDTHKAAPVPAHEARPAKVTLFFTGAENGYLLPTQVKDGTTRGGAAEILGRWAAEGHCPGALGDGGAPACAGNTSLVLSTGDNANGQAISGYFKGASAAELFRHMGYAASAFGNRELDWAHAQFLENTQASGVQYLAANLTATGEPGSTLGLKPFTLFTRGEVKIGVVGLSANKALLTPMPGRMDGLKLQEEREALDEATKAARAAGANMLVVLSDGCLNELADLFGYHPRWGIAVVAARRCEDEFPKKVGDTHFVYPGSRLTSYVKADVYLDLAKPAGQQVDRLETKTVAVVSGEGAAPADPKALELVAAWKTKLDEALGKTIGHTATGMEQESAEASAWIATALKESFKADVGLFNRKGVRQGLPEGDITEANVWDVLPFQNEVVVAKVSGEALVEALSNVSARYAGVRPTDDGFVDAKGAAIDPKKTYTVATVDYLYLGGDGFAINKADPEPTQTKKSWQSVLIEWTKAKKSSEKKPLESFLKVK